MPAHLETIQGLEIPPHVAKNIRRAGGFGKILLKMPDSAKLSAEAEHNLALSDRTRLMILWALSSSDLCPCLLKRITNMSDSKLSYHLGILEEAGLIRSRRERSWRVYSITKRGKSCIE